MEEVGRWEIPSLTVLCFAWLNIFPIKSYIVVFVKQWLEACNLVLYSSRNFIFLFEVSYCVMLIGYKVPLVCCRWVSFIELCLLSSFYIKYLSNKNGHNYDSIWINICKHLDSYTSSFVVQDILKRMVLFCKAAIEVKFYSRHKNYNLWNWKSALLVDSNLRHPIKPTDYNFGHKLTIK